MKNNSKNYRYPYKPIKTSEEIHRKIVEIARKEQRNIQVVCNNLLREAIENRENYIKK